MTDRKKLTTLYPTDQVYNSRLRQYVKSQNPYYSFVSSNVEFEIFRITTEPKSVDDFKESLIETVSVSDFSTFGEPLIRTTGIFDFLEHQKKYYYLFRTLTHYKNPSNPSPIYMVEKFKDADETILKVETFHIEEQQDYQMETSFRKLMKIAIKPDHTVINSNTYLNGLSSSLDANLGLGNSQNESLWIYNSLTKNYIKLRLESKHTGKKIDLNLIFNYNQPVNE